MPRIELNNLIGEMKPEQKIFSSWFYSQFDYSVAGSGLNRRIINVEPIFYQGALAGSEFLVYVATKLYLCLDIVGMYSSGAAATTVGLNIIFYNEANAAFSYLIKSYPVYESAIPQFRYTHPNLFMQNFYFSRLSSTYNYVKFNGYRITLG